MTKALNTHLFDYYGFADSSMPNPARAQRLGTLVASGLIVGESIWGVILAGLIVGLATIALVAENFALAPGFCVIGFVGAIVWLCGWMLRRSALVGSSPAIVVSRSG